MFVSFYNAMQKLSGFGQNGKFFVKQFNLKLGVSVKRKFARGSCPSIQQLPFGRVDVDGSKGFQRG